MFLLLLSLCSIPFTLFLHFDSILFYFDNLGTVGLTFENDIEDPRGIPGKHTQVRKKSKEKKDLLCRS